MSVSQTTFKNCKFGYEMDPQSSKYVVSFVLTDHVCIDIDTDIVILHINIKMACFPNILQLWYTLISELKQKTIFIQW